MATVTTPWTHAKFETAEHRLAVSLLNKEVQLIMANHVTLRRVGCQFFGDMDGAGADTFRALYANMGWGISFESVGENDSLTPISLTVLNAEIALGRFGLAIDETYLAQITARPGKDAGIEMVAAGAALSWEATFQDALATVIQDADTDVGTPGADAAMDDVYDVTYEFDQEDGADGPLIGMFHGRQIADIKESKRGEPGEWIKDESQLEFKSSGFQGQLVGISMFKDNRVAASGGDRHGAVWMPGAIGYTIAGSAALARVAAKLGDAMVVTDPAMIVQWDSTSRDAETNLNINAYFGLEIMEDEGQRKLRGFVTDE